jgi:hypothetical protein
VCMCVYICGVVGRRWGWAGDFPGSGEVVGGVGR